MIKRLKYHVAILFFCLCYSTAFAQSTQEVNPKELWQGWAFCSELGTHFKQIDFGDIKKPGWGHDKRFWGEIGVFVGVGAKYSRVFKHCWYWGGKVAWEFLYPDFRWTRARYTKASKSLYIPMTYADIGYISNNNILYAVGVSYLWGFTPSITIPLSKRWMLETRTLIFLDKVFVNGGYHNFYLLIGFNYKF